MSIRMLIRVSRIQSSHVTITVPYNFSSSCGFGWSKSIRMLIRVSRIQSSHVTTTAPPPHLLDRVALDPFGFLGLFPSNLFDVWHQISDVLFGLCPLLLGQN